MVNVPVAVESKVATVWPCAAPQGVTMISFTAEGDLNQGRRRRKNKIRTRNVANLIAIKHTNHQHNWCLTLEQISMDGSVQGDVYKVEGLKHVEREVFLRWRFRVYDTQIAHSQKKLQ